MLSRENCCQKKTGTGHRCNKYGVIAEQLPKRDGQGAHYWPTTPCLPHAFLVGLHKILARSHSYTTCTAMDSCFKDGIVWVDRPAFNVQQQHGESLESISWVNSG